MASMETDETLNFNDVFNRPPTFCEECGELLDFEIMNNYSVKKDNVNAIPKPITYCQIFLGSKSILIPVNIIATTAVAPINT